MSKSTRITSKGQATIPQELREKYGLEPGDEVIWEEGEDGILVKKRTETGARGLLAGDLTEDERERLADDLEAELREQRETNWTVEE